MYPRPITTRKSVLLTACTSQIQYISKLYTYTQSTCGLYSTHRPRKTREGKHWFNTNCLWRTQNPEQLKHCTPHPRVTLHWPSRPSHTRNCTQYNCSPVPFGLYTQAKSKLYTSNRTTSHSYLKWQNNSKLRLAPVQLFACAPRHCRTQNCAPRSRTTCPFYTSTKYNSSCVLRPITTRNLQP